MTSQSRPRVLVIDDDPPILKLLEAMLKKAEYEVSAFPGAKEALKEFEKTRFQLVLTDAVMPKMDGFELVAEIRKRSTDIPILMLTKRKGRKYVKMALELGVTDYIYKPVDESLLLGKISESLNQKPVETHPQVSSPPEKIAPYASSIAFPSRIVELGENGMTLRSPVGTSKNAQEHVDTQIFDEIHIDTPTLKLIRCEKVEDSPGYHDLRYEFVGISKSDSRKIRTWINKSKR